MHSVLSSNYVYLICVTATKEAHPNTNTTKHVNGSGTVSGRPHWNLRHTTAAHRHTWRETYKPHKSTNSIADPVLQICYITRNLSWSCKFRVLLEVLCKPSAQETAPPKPATDCRVDDARARHTYMSPSKCNAAPPTSPAQGHESLNSRFPHNHTPPPSGAYLGTRGRQSIL